MTIDFDDNKEAGLFDKQLEQAERNTIDELFGRSIQFRNSNEYVKLINFMKRFTHYSRFNAMLVYIQNPAVTFFGGVSYWKKYFDRTVKEDAKPHIILAPMGPVMLVYDIYDTEGALSPEEFLISGTGGKIFEVKGNLNDKKFAKAIETAKDWNIGIRYEPFSFFQGGYITTIFSGKLEICLKEGASIAENFATLMHELAHLFLGHTGHKTLIYSKKKTKTKNLNLRHLSKNAEEVEAETVSYLICHRLGLETRSAEYLAGYFVDDEVRKQISIETIIKTVDYIEKHFVK